MAVAKERPRTLIEDLRSREHEIEQRIDTVWSELTDALESGKCTQAQYEWVLDQERIFGDTLLHRWVFSHFLARCAVRPELIHLGEATYSCGICLGERWVENVEKGGWLPCHRCNRQQFDMWLGGHYRSGHTCDDCNGSRRKRGRAGASHQDEVNEQRAVEREDRQQATEEELF